MFIDYNGEFPLISFLSGFIKGAVSQPEGKGRFSNALSTGLRYEKQSWKITGGLFISDKNLSTGRRVGQVASRFTWELPQTTIGFLAAQTANVFFNVENVSYFGGATALQIGGRWGGICIGSFIGGDSSMKIDPTDQLFQHEYSHYVQSQIFGLLWIPLFGIPSLISATVQDGLAHIFFYPEIDANRRGKKYLIEKHGLQEKDWSPWNPIETGRGRIRREEREKERQVIQIDESKSIGRKYVVDER